MSDFLKEKAPPKRFPPIPDWRPVIRQPIDKIIDCIMYYTAGAYDIAVFESGTCVLFGEELSDTEAETYAKEVLSKIYSCHPDMTPVEMDDGNILLRYNHPAVNIVLNEIVQENWPEIDRRYLEALATDEVLITPLGNNVFDDFGKKALFGRCFMFMDAQDLKLIRIVRNNIPPGASVNPLC
jgi:hypothetical protein